VDIELISDKSVDLFVEVARINVCFVPML